MKKLSKSRGRRKFTNESIPTTSELGYRLIFGARSKEVVNAIRDVVKGHNINKSGEIVIEMDLESTK